MELVDLGRYVDVVGAKLLPFDVLRTMEPIELTHDLLLVDESENVERAESLAARGVAAAPVRRRPPSEVYFDRTDFPRRILFEMTSRCNFLCRMCPQQDLKRPKMDMDGAVYRRVIDEIDEHGIEGLWLYHLGESLLHPEFKRNIEHISSKRNLGVIWMSTNGQEFDSTVAQTVLDSNISYINFSAHAVTEATYKTVAPGGDFDVVQRNLNVLYDLKGPTARPTRPFVRVQMIEQETTRHEVDAFIAAHYARADMVSVNMLEYVNLPNNAFGSEQRSRPKLRACTRVSRNDCFICSNGHVTLCDAAYNGELFLGDVNKQTLYEIWNGERRAEILSLNEEGRMDSVDFCRTCTDYDI